MAQKRQNVSAVVVAPDWGEIWTAEGAEAAIRSFKFAGPGIYFIGAHSLLVTPIAGLPRANWGGAVWQKDWPPTTRFMFQMWTNIDISQLINAWATAPVRVDAREI